MQVSCLSEVCGLFPFEGGTSSPSPSPSPNQIYRLFTSLLVHAGVAHLLISLSLHWTFVRFMEILAGPFRTAAIYFLSGITGNLVSSILLPYQAQVTQNTHTHTHHTTQTCNTYFPAYHCSFTNNISEQFKCIQILETKSNRRKRFCLNFMCKFATSQFRGGGGSPYLSFSKGTFPWRQYILNLRGVRGKNTCEFFWSTFSIKCPKRPFWPVFFFKVSHAAQEIWSK